MKRIFILLCFSAMFGTSMQAQLFNAAKSLGKGQIFVGLEPAVLTRSGTDAYMFFHGGVGVTSTVDFSLHAGFGKNTYLGGNLEWLLAKNLTLTTGVHNFDVFGLNSALTYAVPLNHSNYFWFGGDLHIDFANPDVVFPLWVPIGVEVAFQDRLSFLLESEIAVSNPARNVISGGLVIYFR